MLKKEIYYDSRDQVSKIHAVYWIPEGKPRAVIQLVHGMAEYIERYEPFAEFLTGHGFLVTGNDHLGHGKSKGSNPYGYFCKRDAATVLVRDVHRLKKMTQEEYPGLSYFMIGHSMGSMILRNYLCRYGTGIQGAVIMSTGIPKKSQLFMGAILAHVLELFQGTKRESRILNRISFGSYCDKIENPSGPNAWISTSEETVAAYEKDKQCGFLFTINGFFALKALNMPLYQKEYLEKMPKSLPVMIVYGTEDPVGNYGVAPEKLYRSFQEIGMQNVFIKKYEGMRHELLNEKEPEQVMQDILYWIDKIN